MDHKGLRGWRVVGMAAVQPLSTVFVRPVAAGQRGAIDNALASVDLRKKNGEAILRSKRVVSI